MVNSLLISLIVGIVFAVIADSERSFIDGIMQMTKIMLLYFGIAGIVGGFLMIATPLQDNLCFGFGCSLYYGTAALSYFLEDLIHTSEEIRFSIAFVIVALVCYIIWLTRFKPEADQKQIPIYDKIVLAEPLLPLNTLISYTRDKDGDLILEMADGSEYCYYDFPNDLYQEMKGFYNTVEFIDRHVKGKYKCEKIS